MSRLIDADAYAAEMKLRQDALKEKIDAAVKYDNWELYDKLSRPFGVFVEAKLTLDKMPTVDAVPVVRCNDCTHMKWKNEYTDGSVISRRRCELDNKAHPNDWFCADGERR